MTELPIACTLDRAEMPQRAADIRSLGRDGLVAVDSGERRVTLRFRRDPTVRERLEAIVAAESSCCSFLDFGLASETDAGSVLTIAAPEGAEPALDDLVSVFSGDATGAR